MPRKYGIPLCYHRLIIRKIPSLQPQLMDGGNQAHDQIARKGLGKHVRGCKANLPVLAIKVTDHHFLQLLY